MKKYIESVMLMLLGMVVFTACSDDDNDYQWATASGEQVFFNKDLPTKYDISYSETSFKIPVSRIKTDDAITVGIELTDTNNVYKAPASVSFAAGEATADIVISYDPEKFEYNDYKAATLTIADDYATAYGLKSFSFTAGVPMTWSSLGKGTYVDGWFGQEDHAVEVLQCDQNPTVFRVKQPYATYDGDGYFLMDGKMDDYLELTLLNPGDTYRGVSINQKGLVAFSMYASGALHPSYADNGSIYLVHPSSFNSLNTEENYAHNRVLSYQENGLPGVIQLAPYFYIMDLGGWNNTDKDGVVEIYFPGNEKKDYDVAVEYIGAFVDAKGNQFATTNIEMGADLSTVKYVLIEGEDVQTALNGIIDGSIEAETLYASEEVNIPCPYAGTVTVVAVGFADGEAQSYDAATFSYKLGGDSSWKVVGTGDFLYTQLFANSDGTPYNDEGLTVSQNLDYESLYKVEHWGYDVDFYFTWDKNTNKCSVPAQYTGYTHSTYGKVYVSDIATYDDETTYKDAPCVYDAATNTFTFNVIYYVSAGYLAYGPETFTVTWGTGDASEAPRKIARRQDGFKPVSFGALMPKNRFGSLGMKNLTTEKPVQ